MQKWFARRKKFKALAGKALVKLAAEDKDAFGELYERYLPKIYNYIFYRTGNTQDAEDLTAKVFFRAMSNIGNYVDKGVPFSGVVVSHRAQSGRQLASRSRAAQDYRAGRLCRAFAEVRRARSLVRRIGGTATADGGGSAVAGRSTAAFAPENSSSRCRMPKLARSWVEQKAPSNRCIIALCWLCVRSCSCKKVGELTSVYAAKRDKAPL